MFTFGQRYGLDGDALWCEKCAAENGLAVVSFCRKCGATVALGAVCPCLTARKCGHCCATLTSTAPTARYCSARCRDAAYRARL